MRVAGRGQEALKGDAVVEILAGVELVADVDADRIKGVQNGQPAAAELGEGFLDQPRGPLRPRVKERPGQSAREGRVCGEAEVRACLGRELQLLNRPRTSGGFGRELCRGKAGKERVVGRMHGNQLALQMRRELGDDQPCFARVPRRSSQ